MTSDVHLVREDGGLGPALDRDERGWFTPPLYPAASYVAAVMLDEDGLVLRRIPMRRPLAMPAAFTITLADLDLSL